MKKILCLASLLVISCSTTKKNDSQIDYDQAEDAKAPEWVYAPDEGCGSGEICAAGEGESMGKADARAKTSLASIFSTRIQSQLDIHKTDYSDEEISEIKEYVNDQVSETVDEALKTAEIRRRYERDGLFFSLASIDRRKTSRLLKREIEAIDNEINHLYSMKRKSSIKRLMGLLDQRSLIADKLIVVDGQASRAPITFSQVQNIKYSSGGYNKVFIRTGKNVPSTLSKYFQQMLTNSGYRVAQNRAVDYILELKYEAKETFLNVEGFKKFVFTFTALASNNVNEEIGGFTVVETQTGRTEQDAYLRIKNKFQKEIEKKLSNLNLK